MFDTRMLWLRVCWEPQWPDNILFYSLVERKSIWNDFSLQLFDLSQFSLHSPNIKLPRWFQHHRTLIFTVCTYNDVRSATRIVMALLLWLPPLLICRAGEVSAIQSGSGTAAVMTTVCMLVCVCVNCLLCLYLHESVITWAFWCWGWELAGVWKQWMFSCRLWILKVVWNTCC